MSAQVGRLLHEEVVVIAIAVAFFEDLVVTSQARSELGLPGPRTDVA
jgi:hypothetical protein